MSKLYIYSTLSASVEYEVEGGKTILIKGGANIADKYMLTPLGVATCIEDSDLPLLRANRVFALHMANGFLHADKSKMDIEVVVADMERADNSAPDTEADVAAVEVKTGTKTKPKRTPNRGLPTV